MVTDLSDWSMPNCPVDHSCYLYVEIRNWYPLALYCEVRGMDVYIALIKTAALSNRNSMMNECMYIDKLFKVR